jgi:hypothetical protein
MVPVAVAAEESSTRILDQVYARANEYLAQGQNRRAAEAFRVVADAVPELPEPNAAAALALALADWSKRDDAVPYVRRALAAEPANPVAGIIATISDPALSVLRDDGALHLTPRGRERLIRAGELVSSFYPGLRAKPEVLARFAASAKATGDGYFPTRIPGFRKTMRESSFGAMFVVDVPPGRLAAYDPRIIDEMRGAVAALAANQRRLEDLRARLADIRAGFDQGDRLNRIAAVERRVAELEASASEREQRLLMIELRGTGGEADVLRRERAWIDALNRAAAKERGRLDAIRTGRE